MTGKLLTEHHLEVLRLKGGHTGLSESKFTCQNATLLEITCRGSFSEMIVPIIVDTIYHFVWVVV